MINDSKRAGSLEELAELFNHCKAGRLFDVQHWIDIGKPINPPATKPKHSKFKSPLLIAIDLGFHSLVEVLLRGGAIQEPDDCDSPISKALGLRRRDLVELLVAYGYEPSTVDMTWVLSSWDPELMEYFIERGADLESNRPFAWAFAAHIRTALNVFKKYREHFPSLQEQANIGLRHHCKNGNMKWVSLMLWAGADPFKCGPASYNEKPCEYGEGLSALQYAAIYKHHEVFKLKAIRTKPTHPELRECIYSLGNDEGFDILRDFLKKGLNPNDESGSCSAIQSWLNGIDWVFPNFRTGEKPGRRNIDTERARESLKAIHLVAKHGGKWKPDEDQVKSARRSLLKMIPDYTIEFIWIMSKYDGCSRAPIVRLLNSPSMRKHINNSKGRIDELVLRLPEPEPETLTACSSIEE